MRYIISIEIPDDLPLRTGMMTDLMRSECNYLRQATWERMTQPRQPYGPEFPVQIIVKLRGEVVVAEPPLPPPLLTDSQVDALVDAAFIEEEDDYEYDEEPSWNDDTVDE